MKFELVRMKNRRLRRFILLAAQGYIVTARRRVEFVRRLVYIRNSHMSTGEPGESGNIISLFVEAVLEVGRRLGAVLFVSLCTNDPQVSITYYWLFTVR